MTSEPSNRGRFITLEGIEGAGKSTQVETIAEHLRGRGLRVVTTREPGGSPIAERMRTVLLDPQNHGMSDTAELLLMFAARAEHLEKTISPALEAGTWVICDRFTDATYAYQGGGRGVDPERISILESLVQAELRPDLTLVFDLSPEVGLARANARSGGKADRFEAEALEFFTAVRSVYLARAAAVPERYRLIDAGVSVDLVRTQVRSVLEAFVATADSGG